MSELFPVSSGEVVQHIKLSLKIPSVVESIVSRKIVERVAERENIQVEPTELQQAADAFRLENNLSSAESTFAWLQKYRLSVEDFEALIYADTLASKLAQHLFDNQVESFFSEHELDYVKVVMYEVILHDRDLALELFYALQENEISFDEVVRRYAEDPKVRRSRGYPGTLYRSDLPPEIEIAVFSSQPPQVLRPIVISDQAHLIYVEELIRPELDDSLRAKIRSDLFSLWLNEQLEQAEIRVEL